MSTERTIAAGTVVTVTSRKGIAGTIVEFIPAESAAHNFGMGDLYLINFGKGRTGYNTPAQIVVAP